MWAKILFWTFSICGFIIGFVLGKRGDFLGLVGLIASNGMIFFAFALSIITRARETRRQNECTSGKTENTSVLSPPETTSNKLH